jgi:hypothetical protein
MSSLRQPTFAGGPVVTGPITYTPLAAPLWSPEPVEPPSTMALKTFWPQPNTPYVYLPSKRPNQVRSAYGATAFSQFGWCEYSAYLTISVTDTLHRHLHSRARFQMRCGSGYQCRVGLSTLRARILLPSGSGVDCCPFWPWLTDTCTSWRRLSAALLALLGPHTP